MDRVKLQVLAELLEEYRAGCAAEGLLPFARKVASVRNAAREDLKDRKRQAVVVITEGRQAQATPAAKVVRQLRS